MELVSETHPVNRVQMMARSSDVLMAAAVVGILVFMVIPLPTILLDLLLAFNITAALVVLLVGMYILRPLELSSFPSILLIATLFRLSLNVASTRMILLNGHEGPLAAGRVIRAFGDFVVGGNYLVGIIVFFILVIINENEAKQRRELIAREAEYYGAMDGANKFVRGDAIAGIIITLIDILGGLTIGVLQNGLSLSAAAQNYTLLTVGDGLVTQIPALIISTAAGIVVSRAGSESSLGKEITSQVLVQYRPIGIAAAVIFGFGLVPGLPTIPFMILSLLGAGLAYTVYTAGRKAAEDQSAQALREVPSVSVEKLESVPLLDILAIEVGYGLIPLVDTEQNGELLNRIRSIRQQFAHDIGIIVSPIHIQDNMSLKPGEYRILLKGNEIGRGELMVNHYLAISPGSVSKTVEGITTHEPTFGLPALWVKGSAKEKAVAGGYTVVDPAAVLTTHLSELIRRYAAELVGRQEVQQMLDTLRKTHPKVVDELVPTLLPLGAVVRVIRNLLREQVPVRDLLAILETLGDWATATQDTDLLTEYVRQSLSRTITRLHLTENGSLSVVTLGHAVESMLTGAVQQTEQGRFLAIDPSRMETIVHRLAEKVTASVSDGLRPVILCSTHLRLPFKNLIQRYIPDLVVLAYEEILPNTEIRNLGTVEVSDAD